MPDDLSTTERVKLLVEIWKKTVDVQQHFNDLELRIRNFAVTVLAAVFGAAGIGIREKLFISVHGFTTPLAVWFLTAGLLAWFAFYFMDRWWYHKLLYGAVNHGTKLESHLQAVLQGFPTLGQDIGESSPINVGGWRIRSPSKIDLFYGSTGLLLVIGMIVLHFGVRPDS
jgi:hypothetical protein